MKGKNLLFGLCLCLWTSLGWGQKVINVPWYEATNTYMFDIVKNGVDQRGYYYHGASELFPLMNGFGLWGVRY